MQCPQCQHENREGAKFCDECGTALTGQPSAASHASSAQRDAEAELRFQSLLRAVIGLLQSEGRVTYRTLKNIVGFDEVFLGDLREELSFRRLACDEDGKGLVWTGEAQPAVQPAVAIPNQPATVDTTTVTSPIVPTPSPVTETVTPSNGPTGPADAIATDDPHDEPARSAPEAERRQLTVMFCDL
ncbi:MAG: zinc ribbon domain-containing protein, partial [Candidatus Tectomicrobia bacterium]